MEHDRQRRIPGRMPHQRIQVDHHPFNVDAHDGGKDAPHTQGSSHPLHHLIPEPVTSGHCKTRQRSPPPIPHRLATTILENNHEASHDGMGWNGDGGQ